jgi:lipoprotein NlpI
LLKAQLFYAHLYLGLYWEAMKNPTRALEHMEKASGEHYVPMYMGEMARVHRDRLKAKRP